MYLQTFCENPGPPLLPEEVVRKNLIQKMVKQLNYPAELLAVEVELASIPHLKEQRNLPKRRADIICFSKGEREIFPLLMVECKAVALTRAAIEQVQGYNFYVKAFFLAVANEEEIQTFWYSSKEKFSSVSFLPSYDQLIKVVKER